MAMKPHHGPIGDMRRGGVPGARARAGAGTRELLRCVGDRVVLTFTHKHEASPTLDALDVILSHYRQSVTTYSAHPRPRSAPSPGMSQERIRPSRLG